MVITCEDPLIILVITIVWFALWNLLCKLSARLVFLGDYRKILGSIGSAASLIAAILFNRQWRSRVVWSGKGWLSVVLAHTRHDLSNPVSIKVPNSLECNFAGIAWSSLEKSLSCFLRAGSLPFGVQPRTTRSWGLFASMRCKIVDSSVSLLSG